MSPTSYLTAPPRGVPVIIERRTFRPGRRRGTDPEYFNRLMGGAGDGGTDEPGEQARRGARPGTGRAKDHQEGGLACGRRDGQVSARAAARGSGRDRAPRGRDRGPPRRQED